MRPHHLIVQAFGPFPDTVELDLDRLSGGGLFLLHGDTGSGKTTLLDALGFALYGKVPGVRGKVGRLRADRADPAVRTSVILTVTLGSRLLRITRHPAQEQPKRGGGTRTVNASVVLEEDRGSGFETLSTRLDEAGAELDALLGMSADQFFQVVLLPQGEFATFLRAKSDDRREVLQRLFGTQRFRAVEGWLKDRSASLAGQVAEQHAALERLRHRVAQAADVPLPAAGPESDSSETGSVENVAAADDVGAVGTATGWVRVLTDQAKVAEQAADEQVRGCEQLREQARDVKNETDRLADRQRRRRTALQRQAALAAGAPEVDALRADLTAAGRADGLAGALAAVAERTEEQAAAVAAEALRRAGLPAVGLATDLTPTALRESAEQAGKRLVRLEGLSEVDDDLSSTVQARAAAGTELDQATAILAEAGAGLAALPPRHARAVEQLEVARRAAERLPAIQARLAVLQDAADEAAGLARAAEELTGLRERRLTSGERQLSLRTRAEDLREQRFTSIFAELSAQLEDGVPCEVCGSTEHPDPYLGDADEVTREQTDAAQGEADQAREAFDRLTVAVEVAEATVAAHERRLSTADLGDLTGLAATLVVTEQDRGQLALEAATRDARAATLADIEDELRQAEQSRLRADTALAALTPRLAELDQRVSRLTARLAGELGEQADLAGAQAAAAAVEQVCDAVVEAAGTSVGAARELDRARKQLQRQAVAAGFSGPEQAAEAVRDAAFCVDAQARVQDHAEQVAAVREELASPELEVALEPAADTSTSEAAVRERETALQSAVGGASLVRQRHHALLALLPEVEAAEQVLAPLAARAVEVRALAELCSGAGANTLKMTLTSFVLAARLEEVAAAATLPLLRMTQGRYALVHSDGAVKGGTRSGLELLVRDSWTGEDRPVSTLSGGETFQASLALALGLAEVVQAEAGGARLDALFVDEGFGSLDEETLDEVMDVLDGLREGGRVVGVVSHVAELRSRIPAQVRVTKGRAGSTLEVLGC